MKTMYLILHRIVQHFKNHRSIFLLYLLCVFASSLAFVFFWGNLGGSGVFILENRDMFRRYEVVLGEEIRAGDQRLATLLARKDEDYILRGVAELGVAGTNVAEPGLPAGTQIPVSADTAGFPDASIVYGTLDFGDVEPCAVLPYMSCFPAELIRGAETPTVVLDGIAYRVTGVQEQDDTVMLPLAAFIRGNYTVTGVTVVTPELLTVKEATALYAGITAVFPNASVDDPYQHYAGILAEENAGRSVQVLFATMLFAAAFLSFMFMMKYLMELSRGEDVIFLILGATRGQVALLSLLEILLLGVGCSGAAVLLHAALYKTVFSS